MEDFSKGSFDAPAPKSTKETNVDAPALKKKKEDVSKDSFDAPAPKDSKKESADASKTATEKEKEKVEEKKKVRAPRAPRRRRQKGGPKRSSLEQLIHNVNKRKGERKTVTRAEVEKHVTDDSAWCIIDGHVFDMSPMIKGEKRHPGGTKILQKFAGQNATKQFQMFHYPRGTAVKWGASDLFYIGALEGAAEAKAARPFLDPFNPLSFFTRK
mmetsp:Transcript_15771/g.23759  ORF Transcript_15771/g.23759 Transcript_15771/m.23759 type:complete len:213 (+) Transcript_15771:31-669(+)